VPGLRRFWLRLRAFIGRGADDRDLDRELASHLQLIEDDYARRGLSRDEARRAARLALGGVDQTRELHRETRSFAALEDLRRDLRHAVRAWRAAPGTTAASILTLALGVGVAAAMFSIVDVVLFRPLAVADPDRLVRLHTRSEGDATLGGFSLPLLRDLASRSSLADRVAGFDTGLAVHLTVGAGQAERASAAVVTGDFFPVLGARPLAGRLIGPDDDRAPGGHPVAVLSEAFWTRRFAADPAVVGSALRVNTTLFTVVGVAPRGFHGADVENAPDLWMPVSMIHEVSPLYAQFKPLERRGFTWLEAVAHLKSGATPAQAAAEMSSIIAGIPAPAPDAPAVTAVAVPIAQASGAGDAGASRRRVSWMLVGVALAVLVIAGAVAAGLLLVRADGRRGEMALRYALGASRGRVARQVVAEVGGLVCLASVLGLGLAQATGGLAQTLAPGALSLPASTLTPVLAVRVILVAAVVGMICTLVLGWLVAARVTRTALSAAVRRESVAVIGRRLRIPVRHAFVVVQMALSALLLVGAGLLARTLDRASHVELGFDTARVLTAALDVSKSGYDRARGRQFYQELMARVAELPGVEHVAISRHVPISPTVSSTSLELTNTRVPADSLESAFTPVSPGFFAALGMQVEEGRVFTAADEHGPVGLVVNRAFADRFWSGLNALDQRVLNLGERGAPIIGVVNSTRLFSIRDGDEPMIYVPEWAMFEGSMTLVVRTSGDPLAVARDVQSAAAAIDPSVPVFRVRTLADHVGAALSRERLLAGLLTTFSLLALLLAAVGLYGVMSHAIEVRRREFGIRLALGARPGRLLRKILGEGARLAAVGLLVGLGVAAVASRTIASLLFGVSPTDVPTYAAISALLMSVALAASVIPARRVAQVDPNGALRGD
jgi:predicted permease